MTAEIITNGRTAPPWGPSGRIVYERTYRRTKPSGSKETWPETVERVITGNLSLVYGPPETWAPAVRDEYDELYELMHDFKVLPAGRHLWASGVPGRQFLFNCHVAGWNQGEGIKAPRDVLHNPSQHGKLSSHFEFTFLRLMEGGGVGANYSSRFLDGYSVERSLRIHIVCDPSHPDYADMKAAGLLSADYTPDWPGAFEVMDSREGWAAALVDMLDNFTTAEFVRHPDRVYDVTNVRPKGARLKTFGGSASGPQPFAEMMLEVAQVMCAAQVRMGAIQPLDAMAIDHAIAKCVVAGGNRRSARMSILNWQDPQIFDFINSKTNTDKHWTTNISVEVDEDFFAALNGDWRFDRRATLARDVLSAVAEGMLTNGEPGIWNSALSNQGEPNPVVCTNPCGEIALEEWENCNLGHINLDAFVGVIPSVNALLRAHELMTRFLIRATYGDVNDPKQADKLARNRRIGVGHFGVQGFLAKTGIRYSEAPESDLFRSLLRMCREACRKAARDYAFELRIPEPVKVTTVAPTGTIAKMPGRTEGIHPIYSRYFIRRIRFSDSDPDQWAEVQRYAAEGYKVEPCQYAPNTWVVEFPTKETLVAEVEALGYPAELVESADEIGLWDMLEFQAMYQACYADNAVSFTVNIPAGVFDDPDELATVLAEYLPRLKGTTVMVDNSRPQAPYERITQAEYEAATVRVVADGVDDECASGACPVR